MKSPFALPETSNAPTMCRKAINFLGAIGLLIVLAGVDCRAQFELKRGSLNQLFVASASVPGAGSPSITTPQFKGIQVTSAASSARAITGAISAQYPSAIYRTSYPSGAPTGTAVVLVRSSFGSPFASGVPKYLFADVIFPPLAREGGSTAAEVGYWRPWPVEPGEVRLIAVTAPPLTTAVAIAPTPPPPVMVTTGAEV